jgi:ATP-dependent RNA helicase DeaD
MTSVPEEAATEPAAWIEAIGPSLAKALAKKGYSELTAVQQAVLDPAFAGRDLRITSQTGSGKTLAIGIALRDLVSAPRKGESALAKPFALVLAPTRELALQVDAELRWLYANEKGGVASVTGGASYRDERRALAAGPAVIVGTPGRLIDHLERGSIDASAVQAVVLDEADRMLDLGFREDIESIFAKTPKDRRTHLCSATFPRGVQQLANAVQTNPAHVQGTRLGVANADIDHVVHLVEPRQKLDAIVNLLLKHPDDQTLVFARTRADVAELAGELSRAGFAVAAFSGEMDQTARNRTLTAFKRGALKMLIATDVAARGIDVQDITRVIHVEMPTNADSYTHRSGRTGRAGRKGVSAILVSPAAIVPTTRILRSAGVQLRIEPLPSKADVQRSIEDRVIAELTSDAPEGSEGDEDVRMAQLAERLAQAGDTTRVITRLLTRSKYANLGEARDVRVIAPPQERGRGKQDTGPARKNERGGERAGERRERSHPQERGPREQAHEQAHDDEPQHAKPDSRRGGYATFRVSWGAQHGADPRRLLALVCRRGGVRGNDIGAIRIERNFALVDVSDGVAEGFERSAAEPDPRDPRVVIRRDVHPGAGGPSRPRGHAAPSRGPRGQDEAERGPGMRPLQRKR